MSFKCGRFFILIFVLLSLQTVYAQRDDRIVFTSNRDGNREIYTMIPDGSQVQRLTANTSEDREPVWSPDRTQIAFASNRDGGWGIYVMRADGNNQRRITPDDGAVYDSPAWSPNGQQLAFVSDRAGGLNIFIIGVNGDEPIQLTHSPREVENLEPDWSPDGQKIVYSSNQQQYFHIYTVDVSTRVEQRLTLAEFDHYSPAWSPDGNLIAYVVNGNGYSEIFTMQANGQNSALVVTAEGYFADSITWSPDQQTLAYTVWKSGENRSIQTVSLDGTTVRQLTDASSEDGFLNWNSPEFINSAVVFQPADSTQGNDSGDSHADGFRDGIPYIQGQGDCDNALPPRMVVGERGRVAFGNGGSTLWSSPGGRSLRSLYEGHEFTVTDIPTCQNGYFFWPVRLDDGLTGYITEGRIGANYWIQPASDYENVPVSSSTSQLFPPPILCANGTLPQILFIGQEGYPSYGWGNSTLRVRPGGPGISDIPEGEIFVVIDGPICTENGTMWFKVSYQGQEGWISQGNDEKGYWVTPINP